MDGGQTTVIPLDSDLDIVAQDMLVPVNSPEFLHNRQKFTGRCLPSCYMVDNTHPLLD